MTTTSRMMQMFWEESIHVLRQCVRIVLHGSDVGLNPPQLWPVSQNLKCRKCGSPTVAMLSLQTWVEFDRVFKQGGLLCECGGVLADESSLIYTP